MNKHFSSLLLLLTLSALHPAKAQTAYHLISGFNNAAKGFGFAYTSNSKDSVVVQRVLPYSPAHTAGLQQGDLILHINNIPVRALQMDSLSKLLAAAPDNNNMLTVTRNGRLLKLTISKALWETYNFTCQRGNCQSGACEIMLANGLLLKGSCKNGRINGPGKSYYDDGTVFYQGNFKDNVMEGKGVLTWYSGPKYEGELHNGQFNGSGTYYVSENQFYKGTWKNGLRDGKGFYQYAPGETYDGDFNKHSRDGFGIFTWANGDKYTGQHKNDEFEGKGLLVFHDGKKYDGEWKAGQYNGQGKFTFPDGRVYTGQFLNGDFVKGTLSYADGKTITGEFKNYEAVAGKYTVTYAGGKKGTTPGSSGDVLCSKLLQLCKNNGDELFDQGGDRFVSMERADVSNADSVFTLAPGFQLPGSKESKYIYYNRRSLLANGSIERTYAIEVRYEFTDKNTSKEEANRTWEEMLARLQSCLGTALKKQDMGSYSNLMTSYQYVINNNILFTFSKSTMNDFKGAERTSVYLKFKTGEMKEVEKNIATAPVTIRKVDKDRLCRQLKQLAAYCNNGFSAIKGSKKEYGFTTIFEKYTLNYESIEGAAASEIQVMPGYNGSPDIVALKIDFADYKTVTLQQTAAIGAEIKQLIEQCFSINARGSDGNYTFYDKSNISLAGARIELQVSPDNGLVHLEIRNGND